MSPTLDLATLAQPVPVRQDHTTVGNLYLSQEVCQSFPRDTTLGGRAGSVSAYPKKFHPQCKGSEGSNIIWKSLR